MSTLEDRTGAEAYAQRAWETAFAELEAADAVRELTPTEVERYAEVARLVGRDDDGARLWERAHQLRLRHDEPAEAALAAFWVAFTYIERGEMAHAGGWLARAQRVIEDSGVDCAAGGYVRIPEGLQLLDQGQAEQARAVFEAVAATGRDFGDVDLVTIGRLGRGQALVRGGETSEGATQLDEVMVSVVAGEISPTVAGIIYCAVIEACQEMFDLRRAQEWTQALSDWCDAQPDLVPFRGRCLVYRAEIMQLRGEWPDAVIEAQRAYDRLADPPGQPAAGAALYCQGEVQRLRGAFDEADESFRLASERGRDPEPGLALLRLAQGRTDAAEAAIRHALNETPDHGRRAPLLSAAVEIALARNDLASAGESADELARIAVEVGAAFLHAAATQARGAVALAEGDAREALALLREAVAAWFALDVPYDAARARVLVAEAARRLDDSPTAEAETAAARRAFEELGARSDLERIDAAAVPAPPVPGGLTPRELTVLGLVATGMTNRAIAQHLTLSERTVARHVSNIFGKLEISSRAAATAYAYEHGLV